MHQDMKQIDTRTTILELMPTLLRRAAWAPMAVFLLYAGIAFLSDAYSEFPIIGILLHMIGGVAIAFFFWRSLEILEVHQKCLHLSSVQLRGIFAISLTATAAVFWEFAEYIGDWLLGTTMQEGLGDTMLDMFLGIACGTGYVILAQYISRCEGKRS